MIHKSSRLPRYRLCRTEYDEVGSRILGIVIFYPRPAGNVGNLTFIFSKSIIITWKTEKHAYPNKNTSFKILDKIESNEHRLDNSIQNQF